MTLIYYIIIYWLVCLILLLGIQYFNTREDGGSDETDITAWIITILISPLLPIIIFFILDTKQIKDKVKAILGLRLKKYLCFSRMGGAGIIRCTFQKNSKQWLLTKSGH